MWQVWLGDVLVYEFPFSDYDQAYLMACSLRRCVSRWVVTVSYAA